MSQIDLDWLVETAKDMDSIAEIGCLHGRSSFALLGACEGPVYCIDPWDPEHDSDCYASFMAFCGRFDNLRVIRGCSPAVADQVPDVDFTFIDGDHSYEGTKADIEAWLPKTRKVLAGHDYTHPEYAGVKKAVDEVVGDRMRVEGKTSIWVVEL